MPLFTRSRRASALSVSVKLSLAVLLMLVGNPVWAEGLSTVTGDRGDEQTTAYADEWAFAAGFDLQRLLDWDGGHLQITITDRNGRGLDQTANLHTLEQVQEIYGRGQTWRLSEFRFLQTGFDDHLSWKVGRWYDYPASQWGTRLEFAVHKQMKLSLGVYQVNPIHIGDSWARHDGLSLSEPSGTTGALIPLEFDWTPRSFRLPDSFKFGDNVPVQSSKYAAKSFYGRTPWPFVTLRPNLQYGMLPGGSSAYASAIGIGLKTTVKF